jgi:hypothetical protein
MCESDDMSGMEEDTSIFGIPPMDVEELEEPADSAEPMISKNKDGFVSFTRIKASIYEANQETIKTALRSSDLQLHIRFPRKFTIEAKRFNSSTDLKVYTLELNGASLESAVLNFPLDEFPAGFIDAHDCHGRRWKCVAYWNGESIKYIVSTDCENRLCGSLFSGSTKGGKVRWDKAVVPNNLVPGKFDKFAVSDQLLLDRRKAVYPGQLKQLQKSCNIEIQDISMLEKKKVKSKTSAVLETPKAALGTSKAALAMGTPKSKEALTTGPIPTSKFFTAVQKPADKMSTLPARKLILDLDETESETDFDDDDEFEEDCFSQECEDFSLLPPPPLRESVQKNVSSTLQKSIPQPSGEKNSNDRHRKFEEPLLPNKRVKIDTNDTMEGVDTIATKDLPSAKNDFYIEVVVGNLRTRITSDDAIQVDMVTVKNGKLSRAVFKHSLMG